MISSKKNRHYEDVLEQGKDLIGFYNVNPCIAAFDLLGVDFAPIQRLVFEDMWFRDYVITVAGRGFGKSQYTQSLAYFSNKGLVYLDEELPPIPSYLRDGEEEIIDWDAEIYTSKGYKSTKKLCLEKGIDGKFLKTQNGFENRGSNHHPLLTLDSNCKFIYKSLEDLIPGDSICIQRNQQVFGNNNIPEDDAYLIGLFVGDGSIGNGYTASITTEDHSIKEFCELYCYNHNIDYRIANDNRTKNTVSIFFKAFSWFFDKYGIDRCLSYDKCVPYSIRTATRESQIAFLQGYFDTDGTVHNTNGGVSCCSVSEKLTQEIQLMLLNFGIISILRKKKTKSTYGKAYLLDAFSEDSYKFKEIIGFRLDRKQKILNDYFENKELNVNKDTIPYALSLCHSITKYYHKTYTTSRKPSFRIRIGNKKSLSYKRLHQFLEQCREVEVAGFSLTGVKLEIDKLYAILKYNYYFDVVESVEDWKGDCYDFEMDMVGEPNYFSNGFINHNTFMLGVLASLSCMLRPGYRVGLIAPVFRQCFPIITDSYDTFWTSGGLNSTSTEFYNSIIPDLTQVQSLYNSNSIINKWLNPVRPCLEIITTKGYKISGTVDHNILVLGDDLSLEYKQLEDIKKDDLLVIRKGFNYFGNNNSMPIYDEFEHNWRTKDCLIPTELTEDLAYWMGLLVGDGCVSISKDKRKQRVSFVSEDQDLLDSFENYIRKYFCIDKEEKISRRNRKNNTWEIEYYCKKLTNYLLKCGFTKTTALDKKIPGVIKKASQDIFIAFLQALFDTDGGVYIQNHSHGYPHCEVHFSTSSLRLAREIHAVLLNLGIISNLGVSNKAEVKQLKYGNKPSKCVEAYKIRITGHDDLIKFNNIIGFRFVRKQSTLNDYLNDFNLKVNRVVIPNKDNALLNLLEVIKDECKNDTDSSIFISKLINRLKFSETGNLNLDTINKIIKICDGLSISNVVCDNLKLISTGDLYFVSPQKFNSFSAPTIDIEVENEHCYWANGFINHNSKMIFSEIEKLYAQSSILREACEKRPTRGSDTCYLKFKSVAGMTPSFVEALPLGDGNKIRGSRFYLILIDELAQVPDQTLDMVVRPMGATSLAPMERVRRLEQQQRLISLGIATAEDFEEEAVNKMVMTSSGYYKFNHMWRRMKDHWSQVELAKQRGESCPYSVWQVPYWDLPEGFLDNKNIEEARRVMSHSEFRMEYEAAMISDSEGFFKASLLEQCTSGSGHTIELRGRRGSQYILGVDPNQGGKASTGVVIVKVTPGGATRIVGVLELKKMKTQDLTMAIQGICDKFNVIRIFMDKGGGGKAICDLLEEGYNGCEPIIDRTNDDHKHLPGRHILELVHFNPAWISDANFTTKSMLEDMKLLFPETPIGSTLDLEATNYENINVLKSQMLSIIVTQTATGILHFDTPTKGMNKDLYSAVILAAHGARTVEKELEGAVDPVLYNVGGMVRLRNQPSKDFNTVNHVGAGKVAAVAIPMSAALLQKKIK